tara:strand:- start:2473 stop:3105 length:633 start_codon:yes stop_codon:yes gene_type:complete
MKNLTTIIFDLGGVILNIDYNLTIQAFNELGIKEPYSFYSKKIQNNIFNKLETGKISNQKFIEKVKELTNMHDDKKIISAWNKMILDLPAKRVSLLKKLRKKYNLFLLSNTNSIHINHIENKIGKKRWCDFKNIFNKIYLSHLIKSRKPSEKAFKIILNENNLKSEEVLFIDDSPQHIKTAKKLGINVIYLKEKDDIINLFSDITQLKLH